MEKDVPFFALCTRIPLNELIPVECAALTGSLPETDGLAFCTSVEHVIRAAYVQSGLRLIAQGHSLDHLVSNLIQLDFPADDFHLEFFRLTEESPIRRQRAILEVADALKAYPNLDHPQHRFAIVVREEEILFGEMVSSADHSYQIHETKPWHMSTSLPTRLARALVNLAGTKVKSVLDPCCGSGSIILEACALGLEAYGRDINPRMVGMTRKNLEHFGYQAEVDKGDARECSRAVDVVVTDLPYGLYSHTTPENLLGILKQAVQLAPLGIFVAGEELTTMLYEAGYQNVEIFRIQKRREMTRFIFRAR